MKDEWHEVRNSRTRSIGCLGEDNIQCFDDMYGDA